MKKIISLLMAIILLTFCFGLVSCGGGQKIIVNGENLAEYTVVIPKDCDKITEYAAENFVFLVNEVLGITLTTVTDEASAVKYEILIGETNREESKTDTELKDGEYLLFTSGTKIVMKGYGIYVGGACGDFVNKHIKPMLEEGKSKIKINSLSGEPAAQKFTFADKTTSVIFMIGDGMGNYHVEMGERNGIGMNQFIGRSFPINKVQCKTASLSVLNGDEGCTDSAASATALSTGYKTLNEHIGVDLNGNTLLNVRELARSKGAKTAVLTTDVITGATPSGYLCHHTSRHDTEILQNQIDTIISNNEIDYIKGSVEDNLTVETKAALRTVSSGDSFFVMIEEAYIDKNSHDHNHEGVIHAMKRFNDAATYATEYVLCHPDVALIITADHETGALVRNLGLDFGYAFSGYNHTNYTVPVFAMGTGTEVLNKKTIDNTDLAKFVASVYTSESFGNTEGYGE